MYLNVNLIYVLKRLYRNYVENLLQAVLFFSLMANEVFLSKGKGPWPLSSILEENFKSCQVLVRCVKSWADKKYYLLKLSQLTVESGLCSVPDENRNRDQVFAL